RTGGCRAWRVAAPASGFFCQAEDGIRDGHVTGVQTCALPIFKLKSRSGGKSGLRRLLEREIWPKIPRCARGKEISKAAEEAILEIGRASCREREKISEVAGW